MDISPDAQAAAFDPEAQPPVVGDLTEDDGGTVARIDGKVMTLLEVYPRSASVDLIVRIGDNPFESSLSLPAATPYELISAPVRPADMIDSAEAETMARELDRLGALIEAREAEIPELKKRKRELADKLLEYLAAIGEKNMFFGSRRVYIFPELVPEFEQRDDGRRYTMRDLAPVLRKVGYPGAVKPEEAGFNALLKIFRDHAKAETPLPPELAAMVHPKIVHTVRVGVGKTGKSG